MTTVYYTFCEQLPQTEYRREVSLLPDSMQERISKYRRWQDAHAYLYGRLLLKEGMRQLGYTNALDTIKRTKYGKPYFVDSSFAFNISHSGEYIVCVISTDEQEHLGIDIEKIKPIVIEDFSGIFSSKEKKEIDNYDKFYTCWTRKEAIVKADGRGFHVPLDSIDTTSLLVRLDTDEYHICKIDIDNGYMVNIASLNKLETVHKVHFLPKMNAIEHLEMLCLT
ncbi:4'-phosphopantetheinyl transferase superfamily protein [Aquimarina addita]|uniref:4'-phosphopantetheinyl transferase superfamily protein n=1 Tax=Aquimarina addita TaxID=870485 RepID=A0ABP7XHM4_9FLAO